MKLTTPDKLLRISDELTRVKPVCHSSGLSLDDIDKLATQIACQAAAIADNARARMGSTRKQGTLLRQVRRALGFTYP